MSCSSTCPNNTQSNEVLVDNTLFKYNLNEINDNSYDLVCTPCNVPTAVYCVARITKRTNCCNNMDYYQSFINTDPVEIIQDCSLEDIICRSIAHYMNSICNATTTRNGFFNLF